MLKKRLKKVREDLPKEESPTYLACVKNVNMWEISPQVTPPSPFLTFE